MVVTKPFNLKPNGTVIIFVTNRAGFWCRSDVTPFGFGQPYSYNQVDNLMNQTNFEIKESRLTMNGFPSESNLTFSVPNILTYILKTTKVEVVTRTIYEPRKTRKFILCLD